MTAFFDRLYESALQIPSAPHLRNDIRELILRRYNELRRLNGGSLSLLKGMPDETANHLIELVDEEAVAQGYQCFEDLDTAGFARIFRRFDNVEENKTCPLCGHADSARRVSDSSETRPLPAEDISRDRDEEEDLDERHSSGNIRSLERIPAHVHSGSLPSIGRTPDPSSGDEHGCAGPDNEPNRSSEQESPEPGESSDSTQRDTQ